MFTKLIYVLLSFFILIFFPPVRIYSFLVCLFALVGLSSIQIIAFIFPPVVNFVHFIILLYFVRSFVRSFNHSNRCVHSHFFVVILNFHGEL